MCDSVVVSGSRRRLGQLPDHALRDIVPNSGVAPYDSVTYSHPSDSRCPKISCCSSRRQSVQHDEVEIYTEGLFESLKLSTSTNYHAAQWLTS